MVSLNQRKRIMEDSWLQSYRGHFFLYLLFSKILSYYLLSLFCCLAKRRKGLFNPGESRVLCCCRWSRNTSKGQSPIREATQITILSHVQQCIFHCLQEQLMTGYQHWRGDRRYLSNYLMIWEQTPTIFIPFQEFQQQKWPQMNHVYVRSNSNEQQVCIYTFLFLELLGIILFATFSIYGLYFV